MLNTLLHILYVPVCVFLILVVLLQTGKRADLAGAFGGGGSQTAFGARGAATLLAKVTTASAVLFMIIALSLSILTSKQEGSGGSVLDTVPDSTGAPAPAEAPIDLTAPPAGDDPLPLAEEPTAEPGTETDPDAEGTGEDAQP